MKQFDLKNVKKKDLIFSVFIILATAFLLLLPSRLASKGTSPGMSALNAILLVGKCTEIVYEKNEPEVIATLFDSLNLDLDLEGAVFWKNFIEARQNK